MRQRSCSMKVTIDQALKTALEKVGDEKEKNGKAEMAAAAFALSILLAAGTLAAAGIAFSGKVIEAELETKRNKLVWEVEVVTADKKVMEVHIDADTGAVIDVEEEKAEPKKKREHKE